MRACVNMSVLRSNEEEREGVNEWIRERKRRERIEERIKFMLWYAGSEYIYYIYMYIQSVPSQSRFLPMVERYCVNS